MARNTRRRSTGSRGRSRGRGRGGAGGARVKEAALSIIAFILVCGLVFAVLRANNVTDVSSLISTLRNGGAQVENAVVNGKDVSQYVCNVLADPDCVFTAESKAKIGDLNNDGTIDDLDAEAYQKANNLVDDAEKDLEDSSSSSSDSSSSSSGSSDSTSSSAGSTLTADAQKALATLETIVTGEDDGSDYSRSDYPHWATISGKCDARETVLAKAGFSSDPSTCKALTGYSYTDPYTGKTVTDPSKLDIDHIIPLGYVNQHGGKAWTKEQKKAYANDTDDVLIAVDSSANRQKGDKGPSQWMPSNKEYSCTYAKSWVTIAAKYGITLASKDKDALKTTLQSCTTN